jgi:hypothetical protein
MEAKVPIHAAAHGAVTLAPRLSELSDGDLLAGTRRLVGASNQLLASLLAHLAEVEARGIHRTRACSSLYTYCVYELRLSEDAAFRRVSAARLVRRFPAIFDAIASGELHLTAVLMLGSHLTPENMIDVLARAKHRTKREIAQLVRELDPVPDVPARIEPLGPASTPGCRALRRPTWEMFVRSFNPVRHLDPGERPRDWMCEGLTPFANDTVSEHDGSERGGSERDMARGHDAVASAPALARREPERERDSRRDDRVSQASEPALARNEPALASGEHAPKRSEPLLEGCEGVSAGNEPKPLWTGPELGWDQCGDVSSRVEDINEVRLGNKPPPAWAVGRQRYSVQFTTTAEYVELVERAQALLSGSRDRASLAEVHLRAMKELVAVLEKQTYGVGVRSRAAPKSAARTGREGESVLDVEVEAGRAVEVESGRAAAVAGDAATSFDASDASDARKRITREGGGEVDASQVVKPPRQRGRHVPVAIRREVFARDAGRCGYVDPRGERCRETRWLELHHLQAFALGGEHSVTNLALRCRAHNALAAEEDFGRELVEQERGKRHESFASVARARSDSSRK